MCEFSVKSTLTSLYTTTQLIISIHGNKRSYSLTWWIILYLGCSKMWLITFSTPNVLSILSPPFSASIFSALEMPSLFSTQVFVNISRRRSRRKDILAMHLSLHLSLAMWTAKQCRPRLRSTDNRSARLFVQNLIVPERNGLGPSEFFRLIIQETPLNG